MTAREPRPPSKYEDDVEALESEWRPEDGFFWGLREGRYSPSALERALGRIRVMAISEEAVLPRRVVSLLWYIPLFMHWQVERVRERGGDVAAYQLATTRFTNEVERLLGVP